MKTFLRSALAACALAISFGSTAAQAEVEIAPPALDATCANADLELLAAIWQTDDSDLDASQTLIDTAILLEFARITCTSGDIASAILIYASAIRQLEVAAREISKTSSVRAAEVSAPTQLPKSR